MTPPPPVKEDAVPTGRWPYRFQVVPLKNVFADHAYQRELTSFVDKIANDFNPALVGCLILSERSKTRLAAVDGQTRSEGARRAGIAELPALVYEGLSIKQEAELFALLQTERRGMHSAEKFKAQLAAGHPAQVAIQAILEAQGFTTGTNAAPKIYNAVAALEWVYNGGTTKKGYPKPELLTRCVRVIAHAWPETPSTAKGAVMLRGLGTFLREDEDVDEERLISRLGDTSPTELARRADLLREGGGVTSQAPRFMAEAINNQYMGRSKRMR